MIEPAARAILVADPDVLAIVEDRVFFAVRAQGERRGSIVITRSGGADPGALDGDAGYVTGNLNVACLAPTYREAKELAQKAAAALDDYSGTIAGTAIDWFSIDDESDVPIVMPDGGATPSTFGVQLDVSFMYQN